MSNDLPGASNNARANDPHDLAEAIAFALRYRGGKRVHQADESMAQIAAERIIEHLARARFVIMKRPPEPAERRSRGGQGVAAATQRRPLGVDRIAHHSVVASREPRIRFSAVVLAQFRAGRRK